MVGVAGKVLGVAAVVLTFGAAQFALGEDLRTETAAGDHPFTAVNRAAKADRDAAPRAFAPSSTISLKSSNLADTSIIVRLPAVARANNPASEKPKAPVQTRKAAVACEPPVSVLTEVAKLLQPGRCVT